MKYGNNIHVHYIYISSFPCERNCWWRCMMDRMHVQYLLSQNVPFKPHIFNSTDKLRKQIFFSSRTSHLSILHKQQKFLAGFHVALGKFGKRFSRPCDTISFASRRSARVWTKRPEKSRHFVKYMARKRVNEGGGGRGKQKRETKRGPGFDGRGRARGASSNISGEGTCARVAVFFFTYLLLSLFSTESIPDIARRTRAVWSKRITFILRLVGNAYISVPRTNNGDISVRDARDQGRF